LQDSGTGRIISLEYKTVRIKEALKKQVSDFALRIYDRIVTIFFDKVTVSQIVLHQTIQEGRVRLAAEILLGRIHA
jgi:hypothetical protein